MRTVSPIAASAPRSSRTDRSRLAGRRVAHEVGELEGQDAGEDVDADAVLGPVVHRGEREDVRVFHLPEGEFRLGLGPVAGDDLGHGPVVVAGDEHVLAEDLLFEGGAGVRVGAPGQAEVFRLVPGQFPSDDAAYPRLGGDRGDLGFDFVPEAGLPEGQRRGELAQLLRGLGEGGAVEPGGLAVAQFRGVGEDRAALSAVDGAAGIEGGQPAEALFVRDRPLRGGQRGEIRAVRCRD